MTDADTLSGEITQAVICVLQDRGLVPSDDSAVSDQWLRAAGAARVAVMHVLRGMSATDAADRVRTDHPAIVAKFLAPLLGEREPGAEG